MTADRRNDVHGPFLVDPTEPRVARHNREARDVWEAFKKDRPIRVPVVFSGARSVHADENGLDFRNYYADPDAMLDLQLAWQKRTRELPLGDVILGELPESWSVQPEFHPVLMSSCFGCPVAFRPDAVPAHRGLNLSREECRALKMPDVLESGLLPTYRRFIERMDERCAAGLKFLGRPVLRGRPAIPAGNGIFSLALDLRGAEIMLDMYDDPPFVHEFLGRLADWTIDQGRAWSKRDGEKFWLDTPGGPGFGPTDHGIDMLSVEKYEEFMVPLIRGLNARFGKSPHTRLHHCGRGAHLFPAIKRHFGLTEIHALTHPLNDIARVRNEMGHDVWIVAVVADGIVAHGPPERIRRAVKDFLSPEVKGKGRISIWVSGEARGVPLEHYAALYEAVREFGKYDMVRG